ncbi:hypothetical protein ANACOL_02287 [Anaerotruncus colihominis DSM 17241]|uniref:Uncharacterized protein n=1 Tax=Anaerotruncus colihominis DSM 17241 TaxID=445972 RepID=B0PBX9_9FIRM|nr:hypothetical protein ANACOL_02287 [Anaerotruncus colihominis DSM 17241]
MAAGGASIRLVAAALNLPQYLCSVALFQRAGKRCHMPSLRRPEPRLYAGQPRPV